MSHWDFGDPPSGRREAATQSGAGGGPGGGAADDFWAPGDRWPAEGDWPAEDNGVDEVTAPYPITYERDAAYEPWPPAPYPSQRDTAVDWAERAERWSDSDDPGTGDFYLPGGGARRGRRGRLAPSRPRRGHAGPRWLIPAGVIVLAAATGASAILLTGGHPSG